MTFVKGQSGNPGGRRREKEATAALMIALKEIDPTDEKGRTRLRVIAEKLAIKATEGDMAAINAIFDRIDGRPALAIVDEDDEPVTIVCEWVKGDGERERLL